MIAAPEERTTRAALRDTAPLLAANDDLVERSAAQPATTIEDFGRASRAAFK